MYQDLLLSLKKLAKTSQAQLGGVACFIVKNGAIVSSGINHNPTGEPMEHLVNGKLVSRPKIVHAEVAAINAAAKNLVDITNATLLVTMSPCLQCAHTIAQTKVLEVLYMYEWWDKAALNVLSAAGIKTQKIQEKS